MQRDVRDHLSYIIRTDGSVTPAMPDDGEFSVQEIRDYVAGPPELVFKTSDGYVLFHNRDANSNEFPQNEVATQLCADETGEKLSIRGRVFLAHPEHLASFWRQT